MITDMTKLFVELSNLFLAASQDNRHYGSVLIVDGQTTQIDGDYENHYYPLFIRYVGSGMGESGGAVKLTIDQKSYFMEPVYRRGDDLLFDLNINEVVSRDTILETLWGESYSYQSRTVDMHIKSIRQKCENEGIIQTVHGVGYKIKI